MIQLPRIRRREETTKLNNFCWLVFYFFREGNPAAADVWDARQEDPTNAHRNIMKSFI